MSEPQSASDLHVYHPPRRRGGGPLRLLVLLPIALFEGLGLGIGAVLILPPANAAERSLLGAEADQMKVVQYRIGRALYEADAELSADAFAWATGTDPFLARVNLARIAAGKIPDAPRTAEVSVDAAPAPVAAPAAATAPEPRRMVGGARFVTVD